MTNVPNVEKSLIDQIIDELFGSIHDHSEFPQYVLEALRTIAAKGQLTSEAEVTKAITSIDGGQGEAD